MSVEAMTIALHHSRAQGTTKLVLLGIASHDGDGGSWPSVATLARYASCSERTVQRAISELVRLGEISRAIAAGGTASTPPARRPNLFHFLLRCPSECDGSTRHRITPSPTSRSALIPVDKSPETGATQMTPGDTDDTTGATQMTPRGATQMSPEPSALTINRNISLPQSKLTSSPLRPVDNSRCAVCGAAVDDDHAHRLGRNVFCLSCDGGISTQPSKTRIERKRYADRP